MKALTDMLAFRSLADFLDMGGYGFYVWLCYAIVIIALVLQLVIAKRRHAKNVDQLKKYYQRMGRTQVPKASLFS